MPCHTPTASLRYARRLSMLLIDQQRAGEAVIALQGLAHACETILVRGTTLLVHCLVVYIVVYILAVCMCTCVGLHEIKHT